MSQFSNDLDQCLLALNKGDLILYPTDTIWGIGCDATNEQAVAKIYALKRNAYLYTLKRVFNPPSGIA